MKNSTDNSLMQIIDNYLSEIQNAVKLMKKYLGHEDLLNAWMKRKVSKEGQISLDLSFKFHGVGCFLIYNDCDINFDFGPNGRCDGFDEWRLEDYISQKKDLYPEYITHSRLHEDFEELKALDVIVCPKWEPSRHLYYYKKNIHL